MIEKFYQEKIIDEMLEMLRTNLIIQYNYNEDALINLRKYCKENETDEYSLLPYYQLLSFVEEALADLICCDYLYDFRSIE